MDETGARQVSGVNVLTVQKKRDVALIRPQILCF